MSLTCTLQLDDIYMSACEDKQKSSRWQNIRRALYYAFYCEIREPFACLHLVSQSLSTFRPDLKMLGLHPLQFPGLIELTIALL